MFCVRLDHHPHVNRHASTDRLGVRLYGTTSWSLSRSYCIGKHFTSVYCTKTVEFGRLTNSLDVRCQSNPKSLDGVDSTLAEQIQLLKEACLSRSVLPDDVEKAMEAVENSNDASLIPVKRFPECLEGSWRLVFAVPAPIKSWSYIPVVEDAVIVTPKDNDKAGTIALQSSVGPFNFKFSGCAEFAMGEKERAKVIGTMTFSFDTIDISVFDGLLKWQGTREPKQKTYSFFLIDDQNIGIACARSSGTGGKTLLHKNSN